MRRWVVRGVVAIVVLAGVALIAAQFFVADVAEPPFETIRADGDVEVRRYAPMLLASVDVAGGRGEAASNGFRVLADYIFGNNTGEKIAMTAPVLQQAAEEIAMTAPVLQTPIAADRWTVSFVMPEEYTMETLPKPNDERVTIRQIPGETVAALRFSGFHSRSNLAQHAEELRAWLQREGLEALGPIRFAFYDPPWTLPFLRRNEVMVTVAQ